MKFFTSPQVKFSIGGNSVARSGCGSGSCGWPRSDQGWSGPSCGRPLQKTLIRAREKTSGDRGSEPGGVDRDGDRVRRGVVFRSGRPVSGPRNPAPVRGGPDRSGFSEDACQNPACRRNTHPCWAVLISGRLGIHPASRSFSIQATPTPWKFPSQAPFSAGVASAGLPPGPSPPPHMANAHAPGARTRNGIPTGPHDRGRRESRTVRASADSAGRAARGTSRIQGPGAAGWPSGERGSVPPSCSSIRPPGAAHPTWRHDG